jgi:hypothetical protein
MQPKILANRKLQLGLGLIMGICFGFLLQKSGVTRYEVIMGQLLLRDWTVAKVMLSAAVTGMLGIHLLRIPRLVRLHKKSGSVGSTVVGGLIFGIGFALLGYCPGTLAGAAGQGSMDALLGGAGGMLVGTWIYSLIYEWLEPRLLHVGDFGKLTLPELFNTGTWTVIFGMCALILLFLLVLELAGF